MQCARHVLSGAYIYHAAARFMTRINRALNRSCIVGDFITHRTKLFYRKSNSLCIINLLRMTFSWGPLKKLHLDSLSHS
jgi:hypothetical protein